MNDRRFRLRRTWYGKLVLQMYNDELFTNPVWQDVPGKLRYRFPPTFEIVEVEAFTQIMQRIRLADKKAKTRRLNKLTNAKH